MVKLLQLTELVVGEQIDCKPTKVVAGHEPENTNFFLQQMFRAATAGIDTTPHVMQILGISQEEGEDGAEQPEGQDDGEDEQQAAIAEQQRQQELAEMEADKKRKKKEQAAKKAKEDEQLRVQ